ncbi:MerR-like DNA binding protein [Prauserella shujinwangii]|uniref:MerR-like DNA binding protein n=1 Tax=Prauserella shujinwangii TaxID=1453103 RepID=A0A2T0M2Y6_9PSEU|nr:MerR family transcriptional regulator [Prauserella shujinwangii]PRX51113.1 MerR-like DNA binding protein [Prauserella shujinwangii]
MPTGDAAPRLSIEQLAAEAGLPTSTIRLYQTKGLLHPPVRHGRTASYDTGHLDRLRLVQSLQRRGFSHSAIAELLAARERGASVAAVLGLDDREPDDWVPVRLRDLAALVPARELRPALLRRATRLGLVRWRRGRPQARRWALDSGLRLARLGVPADEVLDRFDRLREHTRMIAADFVALFEQRLWPELERGTVDDDRLRQVRDLLLQLDRTAEEVVLGSLRESIRAAAEEFAGRHGLVPGGEHGALFPAGEEAG